MKPHSGIALDAPAVAYVHKALTRLADDLDQYATWLMTKEGEPLPGMETAIHEVKGEAAEVRAVLRKVYKECFI